VKFRRTHLVHVCTGMDMEESAVAVQHCVKRFAFCVNRQCPVINFSSTVLVDLFVDVDGGRF
jgi:hypothetical protein